MRIDSRPAVRACKVGTFVLNQVDEETRLYILLFSISTMYIPSRA